MSPPYPTASTDPEPAQFERWVELTAAGDAAARKALFTALWLRIEQYVAVQPYIQATNAVEDVGRDVALRVMGRLDQLVTQYLEWKRERGVEERFVNWVLTVTRNETLDYARQLFGRSRAAQPATLSDAVDEGRKIPAESLPSRKRLLNIFAESLADKHHPSTRPAYTNIQAAKELMETATHGKLLSPIQLQVLSLWLHETPALEIEALLQLEPDTAEALRRSAIARLRRHIERPPRTAAS